MWGKTCVSSLYRARDDLRLYTSLNREASNRVRFEFDIFRFLNAFDRPDVCREPVNVSKLCPHPSLGGIFVTKPVYRYTDESYHTQFQFSMLSIRPVKMADNTSFHSRTCLFRQIDIGICVGVNGYRKTLNLLRRFRIFHGGEGGIRSPPGRPGRGSGVSSARHSLPLPSNPSIPVKPKERPVHADVLSFG